MLLLLSLLIQAPDSVAVSGDHTVTIPRVETEITVDGVLDEPVWQDAARLTGFSQYRPVDGRPAEQETEVLVWYSPTAIHFGIIAHDRDPGSIRATVADRDNIGNDDNVTIYLDTFLDRRRAFFFGVNPLGVQDDGVRTEGGYTAGDLTGGTVDRNPDFIFDSRGRITDAGYVVEVRIPFKSLRYPGSGPQAWGINVVRVTKRTGYEDTWTDVRRAGASFLAQAGTIVGLHDLSRGIVAEAQPFVTASATGQREMSGRFARDAVDPSAGLNLKLGLTSMAIDATLNPDFSQVESDAGLVTVNERFDLFVPERRPFFLEGIELFATPNQLVYTRRVANPVAGGKVAGKFGRFGLAHLTAVDEQPGDDALVNITRLRRDLGSNSLAGLTYTDRTAGGDYNRVVAADARLVFERLYFAQLQVGRAWTRDDLGSRAGSLWEAQVDRTGRQWGFNYSLRGKSGGFETQSGFVPRTDVVEGSAFNRLTWYGARGARIESVSLIVNPNRIWRYDGFGGEGAIEGEERVSLDARLRGGWNVSVGLNRGFVKFDPADYAGYTIDRGGPVTYDPPDELTDAWSGSLEIRTPTLRWLDASLGVERGIVPIFAEASEGRETRVEMEATLRPAASVRVALTGAYSRITRARDGEEFARTLIPRLRVEYQPTRSLFFRVIAEHRAERQAALLAAGTGEPLLVNGAPAPAFDRDVLRTDWLVSYEPTPGTVAYLGYGASMAGDGGFDFGDLRRTSDGFFVKLAYLFRS